MGQARPRRQRKPPAVHRSNCVRHAPAWRGIPRIVCPGIEDHQHLSHDGHDGHLGGLAASAQALIEIAQARFVPQGRQRRHIQGLTDVGPSAPDAAGTAHRATGVRQRRHTDQFGDRLAIQLPQFRKLAGQHCQQDRPDPLEGLQGVQLRLLADLLGDLLVQEVFALAQLSEVALQHPAQRSILHRPQLLFRPDQQLHHLPSALHMLGQAPLPRGRWLVRRQIQDLGDRGQDRRIQTVGLGQLPRGPGKVPDLAGIGPHYRQSRRMQGIEHILFIASGRLQHHLPNRQGLQPENQLAVAGGSVGKGPVAALVDRHIQRGLAHIDPDPVHGRTPLGWKGRELPRLPSLITTSVYSSNCSGGSGRFRRGHLATERSLRIQSGDGGPRRLSTPKLPDHEQISCGACPAGSFSPPSPGTGPSTARNGPPNTAARRCPSRSSCAPAAPGCPPTTRRAPPACPAPPPPRRR